MPRGNAVNMTDDRSSERTETGKRIREDWNPLLSRVRAQLRRSTIRNRLAARAATTPRARSTKGKFSDSFPRESRR
jgi:hypothetical protein